MERAGGEAGRLPHPRNGKVNNPDCYGGVGRNGGLLGGVGVSLSGSEKRAGGETTIMRTRGGSWAVIVKER